MVLQTRIFFSGQPLFSDLKKMWIYRIKPPFFLVNHFSRSSFFKLLFYTFLEKWLQNKWSCGFQYNFGIIQVNFWEKYCTWTSMQKLAVKNMSKLSFNICLLSLLFPSKHTKFNHVINWICFMYQNCIYQLRSFNELLLR